MKNLFSLTFFIVLLISFFSCSNSEEELYNQVEAVFPGIWNIDTFYMPVWGGGINHFGDEILVDTVLHDVGIISIPTFSTDTLDYTKQTGTHDCTYSYQNIEVDFVIKSVSLYTDNDFFVHFRNDVIDNTLMSAWLHNTRILGDNFVLKIINEDQIQLIEPTDENRVLFLSRE